ncbi:3-oxoacyl-ACP synthase [Rubrolithibacter danxiaensis]|uniref:3-oxoacyl-ACP synthase n=1 Tax=Rubrolithibacter danxiaensis TaxID=3390805 RepID=UPI003BF7E23E
MFEIKEKLYRHCLKYIEDRISTAENAIISAQEASKDDTKSSAGDKYETTREMMQQEISRNQVQLLEAKKLHHALLQISPENTSKTIQAGSLIYTSNGNFYFAISAGQVRIENELFFAIAPTSPIGFKFKGRTAGNVVAFNGREFLIKAIY